MIDAQLYWFVDTIASRYLPVLLGSIATVLAFIEKGEIIRSDSARKWFRIKWEKLFSLKLRDLYKVSVSLLREFVESVIKIISFIGFEPSSIIYRILFTCYIAACLFSAWNIGHYFYFPIPIIGSIILLFYVILIKSDPSTSYDPSIQIGFFFVHYILFFCFHHTTIYLSYKAT